MQRGCFSIWELLTARTLNSDVLPAFCRPIMVMSISVALQLDDGQHAPWIMFEACRVRLVG